MGIYVTWGKNHTPYDETNKNYNSEWFKWDRYSENIKRGLILYHQTVEKMNGLQISSLLYEFENLRNTGFKLLKKKPKSKIIEMVKDTLCVQTQHWGNYGDEFSPSNNPYDLDQIKKENGELSVEELTDEINYLDESIRDFKEYEETKENSNTIIWFEEQLKFNYEWIEIKNKSDEEEISTKKI